MNAHPQPCTKVVRPVPGAWGALSRPRRPALVPPLFRAQSETCGTSETCHTALGKILVPPLTKCRLFKVNLVGIAFRIDSFSLNKSGILVNLASHYSSSGGQSLLHQQIRWVTWCCCRYRYFLLMLRNRIFVAGTTPASALYLNLKVL